MPAKVMNLCYEESYSEYLAISDNVSLKHLSFSDKLQFKPKSHTQSHQHYINQDGYSTHDVVYLEHENIYPKWIKAPYLIRSDQTGTKSFHATDNPYLTGGWVGGFGATLPYGEYVVNPATNERYSKLNFSALEFQRYVKADTSSKALGFLKDFAMIIPNTLGLSQFSQSGFITSSVDKTYTVQNNQFKIVWNDNSKTQTIQVFEDEKLLETTTLYYKLNTTFNEFLLARSVKATPRVFESGDCYEVIQESLYYSYGTECKSEEVKERHGQSSLGDMEINVYPNPTADFLFIPLPEYKESTKIQVSDMTGRVLQIVESINNQKEYHLNTQSLPAGGYLIRLYQGDNHFNTKFIKL